MTILEIGLQNIVTHQTCIAPMTFKFSPVPRELAYFWLTIFGCADETTEDKINILSVLVNYSDRLSKVNTIQECIGLPESYCFDADNYELYINYGPNYNPLFDTAEYLRSLGFSDSRVVYIDDIEYLPLLKEAPKITEKQDMINYDKLAMGSGSIGIDNTSGYLSFIKDLNLFSNDVAIYHLPDAVEQERTRTELEPVCYHLIDDVSLSLLDGKITTQDIRASLNVKLPNKELNKTDYPYLDDELVGTPIPIIIGTVSMVPCFCVNTNNITSYVVFKIADSFTSIPGDMYVKKEDSWAPIPIVYSDPSSGTFTVLTSGVIDSEGKPKEAKIGPVTGIQITNAPDAIMHLDMIANGTPFTSSFYDLTEWNVEKSVVAPIGMYINEKTELFELIRQIQEGSSVRFRYEFNKNGLRTIRVDDYDRASIHHVNKEDILENGGFYTDRETVAAYIDVRYNKNFYDGYYPSVKDESRADTVLANIRQRPTISFDTFIIDQVVAADRAADEAMKLGRVRKFCDLTLRGSQYLSLRIYDMLDIELYTNTDEWLGLWKCQVIGVSPDCKKLQNKITVCLIEKQTVFGENQIVRIDHDGNIMTTNTDNDIIRMVK